MTDEVLEVQFRAIDEGRPGGVWRRLFREHWPGYRQWFLSEGDAARPSYLACRRALRRYMPELLPVYESLVDLAGGGDLEARFLSLYCPTPYMTGCSQAIWTRGQPFLVRNYDYAPKLWDGIQLATRWTGRAVMAMTDCMWGVLDGINDAGLVVALSFGGRKTVGDGFGIPLILRYVLEFCETTDDATAALSRIPSHMSYNISVLDANGHYATVSIAPDRLPVVARRRVATNHQRPDDWPKHAIATASVEREEYLRQSLRDPAETSSRFVDRFLEPPLFSTRFDHGWGTLYTTVYDPASRLATIRWPHASLRQSLVDFQEISVSIEYRSI